jgi:Na+-transporting NADH:ubiquinone oxidoreductase subunit NqrF
MVFVEVFLKNMDGDWEKAGEGEYLPEKEEFDDYTSIIDEIDEEDVVYYLMNYYPEEKEIVDIDVKIVVED